MVTITRKEFNAIMTDVIRNVDRHGHIFALERKSKTTVFRNENGEVINEREHIENQIDDVIKDMTRMKELLASSDI